jgi:hypothetical protein
MSHLTVEAIWVLFRLSRDDSHLMQHPTAEAKPNARRRFWKTLHKKQPAEFW